MATAKAQAVFLANLFIPLLLTVTPFTQGGAEMFLPSRRSAIPRPAGGTRWNRLGRKTGRIITVPNPRSRSFPRRYRSPEPQGARRRKQSPERAGAKTARISTRRERNRR